MLTLVTIIAGGLVGADTGLNLRRLIVQTRSAADGWFPVLSVIAPLVTGIATAQSILIALASRWGQLAYFVSGPLLVVYGFVWFQNAMVESRLSPALKEPPSQIPLTVPVWEFAFVLRRIGLGLQMGLLVCAVGACDLRLLVGCVLIALGAALPPPRFLPTRAVPAEPLRCAAGTLLFAIGAGVMAQRFTHGAVPALQVTLILALALGSIGTVFFWRASR
jgi:hypothetical protein